MTNSGQNYINAKKLDSINRKLLESAAVTVRYCCIFGREQYKVYKYMHECEIRTEVADTLRNVMGKRQGGS